MDAKDVPDLSFAMLIEPSGDITPQVIAALPKPDVKLDSAFPRLTYTHRTWSDTDMYYFFNESAATESRVTTIAGHGTARHRTGIWARGRFIPWRAQRPTGCSKDSARARAL
jgi:hypothetical protein